MSPTATTAGSGRYHHSPSPQGDEGTLFRAHHEALRRAVRARVLGSDALVEDACQSAWMTLLVAQPRRETVFPWLVRVAVRRAWALAAADRRKSPLAPAEELERHDDHDDAPDLLAQLHARERVREVARALPARQARLVGLQALGFSHAELAALTGDTPRTVDRQLARARRRLDPLREPATA